MAARSSKNESTDKWSNTFPPGAEMIHGKFYAAVDVDHGAYNLNKEKVAFVYAATFWNICCDLAIKQGLMPNVGEQGNCLFFNSVIRRASNRTVRQVYLLEKRRQEMEHEIDGGMIVSDSDSDCVEEWNRVRDPLDEAGLQFIKKKRAAIRRKPTRELNKCVAEKRYFRRRRSKRVGRIHPDIGQTIEDCIQKRGVGADMWRRTGVLTFDGNKYEGKKVNNEILLKNLSSAMDVYISCVNQSPCAANSERSKSRP
ncbi:hypothetical protein ACROYT_G014330 [Oculina patagonica]